MHDSDVLILKGPDVQALLAGREPPAHGNVIKFESRKGSL